MKKLIVTADDYGVVPSLNKGVLNAVHHDIVNSVAVFPNYDGKAKNGTKKYPSSLENLATLLDRYGDKVDAGCHLTITSGRPLTYDKKARTGNTALDFLVDNDGYFHDFGRIRNVNSVPAREAIKEELIAQVKELEKICPVKHLSNHHDSLTFFPNYYDVYLDVAATLKLPIRSPDIRPQDQPAKYRWSVRAMLHLTDMPQAVRKEVTDFGKIIAQYFADVSNDVLTPDYMDSSHYGPVPNLLQVKLVDFEREKRKKLSALKNIFTRFAGDPEATSMELMLHLCDDDIANPDRYSDIDYPGINPAYFGGRITEFNSVMEYDFDTLAGLEIAYARWDSLKGAGGDGDGVV